ncbi:hypothetical protein K4K58_000158 [Colletotrichum sp. SAR11_239]|nr:hypothetical protein K4K58_000158 [Colletotrichum sp. SAR11_239]
MLPFKLLPVIALVAGAAAQKIKIMPLGDSITEITCWRAYVWDMLVEENLADKVQFVGSMTNNPQNCRAQTGSFDLHHEGHSGWLSINIANQYLQGWLASSKPDIVQYMLGTNDVAQGRTTNDIIASYTKMVGLMRASNPRMKILVDLLIPLSFNGGGITTLNQQIPGWAAQQNSTESPIMLADCSTKAGYTDSMNRDGVHPNDQGDQFIARQVGTLLVKGLSLRVFTLPKPPNIMNSQQPPVVHVPPPLSQPAVEEGPPVKKKRGPKPKPKPYVAPKPVLRHERRYTIEKKREVLMFLEHHRVKNRPGQPIRLRGGEERLEGEYRRPTLDEASEWFKIPYGSIHNWYKNKDTIFDPSLKGRRTRRKRDASGQLVDRNQPDAPPPPPPPQSQSEGDEMSPQAESSTQSQTHQTEEPANRPDPSSIQPGPFTTTQQPPTQQPGPSTEPPKSPTMSILSPRTALPDARPSNATVAEQQAQRPTAGAENPSRREEDQREDLRPSSTSPAAGVDSASNETSTAPRTTDEQRANTVEPTTTKAPSEDVQDAATPLTRTTPPAVGAAAGAVSLQGLLAAQPREPGK